jgi:hypothetical protein
VSDLDIVILQRRFRHVAEAQAAILEFVEDEGFHDDLFSNLVASRAAARMSVSSKEAGGRFGKLFCKLKMRAMPGIREEYEPGVGKLLLKDVRLHRRHHDVIMTVHHKSPVLDVL